MRVQPIRTDRIVAGRHRLPDLLDRHVSACAEGSVLAISTKVAALCQGRTVPIGSIPKADLVARESQLYLPASGNRYGVTLTVTANRLNASAGIDESNANGEYVLWPEDPQGVANEARAHVRRRFGLDRAGVVLTDSVSAPMRRGVTGMCLAHSGFRALNDYVGRPDVFGRRLRQTSADVASALAAAAVVVMGEGDEQTPLAMIEDLPFVRFEDADPSEEELRDLRMTIDDDLFGPLLSGAPWIAGGQR